MRKQTDLFSLSLQGQGMPMGTGEMLRAGEERRKFTQQALSAHFSKDGT
jgi:hypothetical protein